MNKKIIAIICAIVVVAVLVIGAICLSGGNSNSTGITLETTEDYTGLIDQIYEKIDFEMFGLESRELELDDELGLNAYTGLDSFDGIEKVVINEAMVTSSAYQVAMVKVKKGTNVETIKQKMIDGVNLRRWVCVGADVAYATSSDNVIYMVLSDEETAKAEVAAFEEIAGGKIGKQIVRQADVIDFDFDETVQ